MREKLLKLMQTESLTASRLAELLGIGSSGISHIISGRNKPSFDLLQKILKRFPNINPDWLLLDSEQMYRTATPSGGTDGEEFDGMSNNPIIADNMQPSEKISNEELSANSRQLPMEFSHYAKNSTRNVKRVIVLFDDHSFESYELR